MAHPISFPWGSILWDWTTRGSTPPWVAMIFNTRGGNFLNIYTVGSNAKTFLQHSHLSHLHPLAVSQPSSPAVHNSPNVQESATEENDRVGARKSSKPSNSFPGSPCLTTVSTGSQRQCVINRLAGHEGWVTPQEAKGHPDQQPSSPSVWAVADLFFLTRLSGERKTMSSARSQ